jgi:very-short-patch-repair endonuclease
MNTDDQNVIPFEFDGHDVRAIRRDGEAWLVAKDVCNALDLSQTASGVRRLDDDEKGFATVRTPGGPQEVTVINKAGVKRLISTSRKPKASQLASALGMDTLKANVTCIEAEVAKRVQHVFSRHEVSTQHSFGPYRVDMFFPAFDLIVEVDENQHEGYCEWSETAREGYLRSGGLQVIRYYPGEEPIESLFGKIHSAILEVVT